MENKRLTATEALKKDKTYTTRARCTNCEFEDNVETEKGRPVSGLKCPNCGCETLEKPFTWGGQI